MISAVLVLTVVLLKDSLSIISYLFLVEVLIASEILSLLARVAIRPKMLLIPKSGIKNIGLTLSNGGSIS